ALYHEILRQRARVMSDQAGQPMEAVRAQPGSYQTPSIEPPPAWEPPLVGREREVAQLLEALDGAFSGRASFAVLVGEAGFGQRRLVGALPAAPPRRRGRGPSGPVVEAGRDLPIPPPGGAVPSGEL